MPESRKERVDRELIELLNELRVALPGVQVLFAFLLTVPFANGWRRVTELQKDVFFATFVCTLISTALLIAPSAHHRLRFRSQDKEHLLLQANRLAIVGLGFLALALIGAIFLISDVLFEVETAIGVSIAFALGFAWLWYGYPLQRRMADD